MTVAEAKGVFPDNRAPLIRAVLLSAAIAIIAVLFWDAIGNLWTRWSEQQELSHSYFIPLISLWLVWANRKAVAESVGEPSWAGIWLFALSSLFLLIGQLTHIFVFQHVGLIVAIAGLIAAFGGLSLLRATAVPVAFLFFAVPPPYWVITVLSWKFQQISSVAGVAMIRMMDIPVYLSGNIIDLGSYKLQVAEACSGLRYLFPFLSLGVMTAYLFRGPLWQRLIIVAATIPITIVMNSFRIAATGVLVQAYGPEQAEGALHLFEGWVVFLLCLLLLFFVVALLCFFARPRRNPFDALGAPELHAVKPSRSGVSRPIITGALFASMAAILALSQITTTDALTIPERSKFASVPEQLTGWRAEIRPMDPSVAQVLGADDTLVADLYSTKKNELINIYLAYLDAQRDGRSWHSPRQCIPGGGWQISSHEILTHVTPGGKTVHFNRLVIQNRDYTQLVYYWYDQRGRKVANEFVMKFWLIYDAITRKRSDGALVRLITPVLESEGMDDADKRLGDMMDRLEAILPAYVPD